MNARHLIKRFEDGLSTIMDLWPTRATPDQIALGRQLAADLHALADAGKTGDGSDFWRAICRDLARCATEDDPLFFMRWVPVQATMVHGARPSTFVDWWTLRRSPEWQDFWGPALSHRQYGHPPPFPPMLSTNAIAIEHATHLYRFQQTTGMRFYQAECIIEFGGGYGCMCRMIHALGFRGTYIIFDLPHVLALQRYYLALHGLTAENSGIRLCSDLDEIADKLDQQRHSYVSSMSTWAMSEMPLLLRERIEAVIARAGCDKILLAYQAIFEGTDNNRYFDDFAARTQTQVTWKKVAVGAGSAQPPPLDDHYLFGVRT